MVNLPFEPFQGDEHRPFYLNAGTQSPAALLIHGFPGTPAEMRPLAEALHAEGWSVEGLLLRGFGADIATLPGRTNSDWVEDVHTAFHHLKLTHRPVAIVGYSMGAAVAMQVARYTPPDALVLISPFRRLTFGSPFRDRIAAILWPFLKLIFREPKPFQNADFSDPQVRHGMHNFMPDADLDDPQVQQAIRQFVIPPQLFDQLRTVGNEGFRAAPHLDVPTLVVQGLSDDVALPAYTRRTVSRLNGDTTFCEIDANHQILNPQEPSWPTVKSVIVGYLNGIL